MVEHALQKHNGCYNRQALEVFVDYDSIVIGSGAGGLTAAVALSRAGQRVLVLERHYLPGGWCHSFNLEGYQFSPGVHYIGEVQPGGQMREIYEGLGVANDLTMLELNPDGFDHVRIGDFRFDIPKGRERYIAKLSDAFPHEAAGIKGYIDTIHRMGEELKGGAQMESAWDAAKMATRISTLARWGLRPLSSLLGKHISDPLLRDVLSMQAGDHGMSPSRAPAGLHAAVAHHYFNGGYYPKGGARALPKAFIKELRRNGGEIRTKAEVSQILLEGKRAIGVRLADGTEISARNIISNADPNVTFNKLIGRDRLPWLTRAKLDRTKWSLSAVSLFFAARIDATGAGLDSGNSWYTTRAGDVERAYDLASNPDPLQAGEIPSIFLTCTTLKDRSKRNDGVHTFEAFSFFSHAAFARWQSSEYGDRPEDYQEMKAELAKRMFVRLDELVPGLSEKVVFQSVGTPLSNTHYVASTEGNLYGNEKSAMQLGPMGWGLKTSFDGLYMCGASTLGHGVAGATMSGLMCAKTILGCRRREILNATGQDLQILPADHPEDWPVGKQPKWMRREAQVA